MKNMISWNDFEKVEMRVGTVLDVQDFPEARNPSYKLRIDFGELGEKKTSAQITKLYKKEDLIGTQVIAVTNFPPKQIANFMSECLVLGVVNKDDNGNNDEDGTPNGEVILLNPERGVKNGTRIA
jgi:tRNA-binding protein